MREFTIQQSIVDELRLKKYFVVAMENENPYAKNGIYNFARIRKGVVPGLPDLCVFLENGKTVWLEVKSESGKLTINQKNFHEKLKSLGHHVFLVKNAIDAMIYVEKIKNEK